MPRLQLLTAWQVLERGIDRFTGPALNPLHHLGSLGFLCFWSLAASGIYLYAVIDTSAAGAHASIERLAAWPWLYGGWLRSVHRYAADALVLLMGLHVLREWLHGRFAGHHGFSWLTGVPLVVFAFVCAIGASGSTGTRWASTRPRPRPNGWTRCPGWARRWHATS
jgi:quinol-cytochrome oxidoreductase complex cytochrome b subunit